MKNSYNSLLALGILVSSSFFAVSAYAAGEMYIDKQDIKMYTGGSVGIDSGNLSKDNIGGLWFRGGDAQTSSGSATVTNSKVTLNKVTVSSYNGYNAEAEGGTAFTNSGSASASGNKLYVTGGTNGVLAAGAAAKGSTSASAYNNYMEARSTASLTNAYGGTVRLWFTGGGSASVYSNTVLLNNSTASAVYGGEAKALVAGSTSASVYSNTATIENSSKVNGNVYGGYVNIHLFPTFRRRGRPS